MGTALACNCTNKARDQYGLQPYPYTGTVTSPKRECCRGKVERVWKGCIHCISYAHTHGTTPRSSDHCPPLTTIARKGGIIIPLNMVYTLKQLGCALYRCVFYPQLSCNPLTNIFSAVSFLMYHIWCKLSISFSLSGKYE